MLCRLYSFSIQLPRPCLVPSCHPFTLILHCIAGADLPIHIIGEVLSVVLRVLYSFIIGRLKMVFQRFTFLMMPLAVM